MKATTNSRTWGLILPDAWEETPLILARCREISQKYYIIKHDEDRHEDGTAKPHHWHVLCKFANPRQLQTVQGYFTQFHRLQVNSFEKISNPEGAKRYLVHFDQPEKTPYPFTNVETNDLQYKDVFIQKTSSQDEITMLLDQYEAAKTAKNSREFCESFRGILQHMSPYQKLMAVRGLRKDFRDMRETGFID